MSEATIDEARAAASELVIGLESKGLKVTVCLQDEEGRLAVIGTQITTDDVQMFLSRAAVMAKDPDHFLDAMVNLHNEHPEHFEATNLGAMLEGVE